MMSLLNKKFNLFLLVFVTLIVLSAVSSASAANSVSISLDNGDMSTNVTINQTLKFNGTVGVGIANTNTSSAKDLNFTNNSSSGVITTDRPFNGTIYLRDGTGAILASKNITDRNWSLEINTNILSLGLQNIHVYFEGANLTAGTSDPERILDNGDSITDGNGFVLLEFKATPNITITNPSTLRIGQIGNFTVTLTALDPNNVSQILSRITGIPIYVLDENGNFIIGGTTINGTFSFNYLVTKLSFAFTAFTNISSSANFSDIYNEVNQTVNFNAARGIANLTTLWFDSPFGYVIGESATILWNFTGIANTTGKTITLFYYSSNKLQRIEVVPLANSYNVSNVTADGHWNTTFSQSHDNLTVIAVFSEDTVYSRSDISNSTFVDPNNNSRRTTITYTMPSEGLKVGAFSEIIISVNSFNGTPVQSGTVTIIWDDKYTFDVNVINGKASFFHTYTLAGDNRNVTFRYNGEENGTRTSNLSATVPVTKATPNILLIQLPQYAIVGEEVSIAGIINNIALPTNDTNITLQFKDNNGKIWHTITDIPLTINNDGSATAQVNYIYIMQHTGLSLVLNFPGDDNNNAASGTTTTIVNPA